jgi:hypothetical protein
VIQACTIIAANQLAAARVLAESFFTHHPNGAFAVLVVDDEPRELMPDGEIDRRITWWRLAIWDSTPLTSTGSRRSTTPASCAPPSSRSS